MNIDDISFYKKHLRNIFMNDSNFNINIKHSKNENNTNIIEFKIAPHIENRNTYNEDYCLCFSINMYEKKLNEVNLKKCSLLSGTEILHILERIAKIFRLNKIYLQDNSYIKILSSTNKIYNLSLTNMYILSEGLSWYNKFGYISLNFEEEKENNTRIMRLSLPEYMSLLLDVLLNKFEREFSWDIKLAEQQFNNTNLIHILKPKINKLKNIMRNKNINLIQALKIYYKYDEEIYKIHTTYSKFMRYLTNINSLNTLNISDFIKIFRRKIKNKNIRLYDDELEFIHYILSQTNEILIYNNKLMKTI